MTLTRSVAFMQALTLVGAVVKLMAGRGESNSDVVSAVQQKCVGLDAATNTVAVENVCT